MFFSTPGFGPTKIAGGHNNDDDACCMHHLDARVVSRSCITHIGYWGEQALKDASRINSISMFVLFIISNTCALFPCTPLLSTHECTPICGKPAEPAAKNPWVNGSGFWRVWVQVKSQAPTDYPCRCLAAFEGINIPDHQVLFISPFFP